MKSLNFIAEEEAVPDASTSDANTTAQPKRSTRKNKQTKFEVVEDVTQAPHGSAKTEEVELKKEELLVEEQGLDKKTTVNTAEVKTNQMRNTVQSPHEIPTADAVTGVSPADKTPPKIPAPEVVVSISSADRLSAENLKSPEPSPGRTASKIAIAGVAQSSRRSSVRCSLKLRHSLAGLRHSMTQESVRRASRRSMLKRKVARMVNSQCSSNNEGEQ